ncbi:MAG: universal stress protein [Sporichthyaceae bacterium]
MTTNEHHTTPAGEPAATRDEVVVGIDESPASEAALRWAAAHSLATGLPLRLVRTWQMSALASAAVTAGAADYLEATAADARARATRWVLDTLGGDAAEVRWTLEVHEGGAGPVLVALSHGSRLVVVGTHEHTGLRRAVSGSVSHYVLSHADMPVVAVPAPVGQERARAQDAMVMGPLL